MTQVSGWKSSSLATKNQKQEIKWTMKNTVTATLIILLMPAFIFKASFSIRLYQNNLTILKILRIRMRRYSRGKRARRRTEL